MAKTYTKLNIEIDQPITDKIVAVQEDARSRYLDVQLYDDGMYVDLTGQKVRIYMIKPDGTHIMNDGEITDPTSGRCQFALTTQALAACGKLETQIKVFTEAETEVLSTQVFCIFVTKTLLTNETIESTNEYGSLVILFQNVYEALVLMGEMVENFGKPGEVAAGIPVETFWGMLEVLYNINKEMLENSSVAEVLKRIGNYTDTIDVESLFGKLKALGYIKGSDGSWYETIFQSGTKTLPYETVSDYIDYVPTGINFDDTYMYVAAYDKSDSVMQYMLKIRMSDFSVIWKKQLGASTMAISCSVVDTNYIFVAVQNTVYKLRKSDGYILASSTGSFVALTSNNTPYMTQDNNYIYGAYGYYFYKKSKATLETLLTSKALGNSTLDNIHTLNTEGNYVYVGENDYLYKFSTDNFETELKKVKLPTDGSPVMTWLVESYLYILVQSTSSGGIGKIYKYDTNLNLLFTLTNAPYISSSNRINNIDALIKCRDGNTVYLVNNNKKPFKLNLSNPSEIYYAESSAPSDSYSPTAPVRYGSKLLYLVADTSNNKFRIVQLNTQQKGFSTIKGYQEVTW